MKIIVTPDDWSNARIVPSAELATAIGTLAPGRYDLAFVAPSGAFEVKAVVVPEDPPVDPVVPVDPPADPEEPEEPTDPVDPPVDPVDPLPPVDPGEPSVDPQPGDCTLTIHVRRGQQQIAPEGVAFYAEVSGFDAQKPTDGSVYDPTLHDIHYKWSFGEPGQFQAPENLLDEWRDSNVDYGPFPAHVFLTPGDHVVICTATEPSSGKTVSAAVNVFVQSADDVFTAATTVVCASDGKFDGMPAHDTANETVTFLAAMTRLKALKKSQPGKLCRVVFKDGDHLSMAGSTYINRDFFNFYACVNNGGRVTIEATTNGNVFYVYGSLPVSGASISGIDVLGPWDSTTETLKPSYPGGIKRPTAFAVDSGFGTVHDCTADGMWTGFTVGKGEGAVAIFSDCAATNWEDYGTYVSGHPTDGHVAFLGPRFAQHRMALQGGNGKSTTSLGNRHGAMRFHGSHRLHVSAADLFPRNGWTVVGQVPVDQNPIRDHRNDPRMQAFFTRIMSEGGWQAYSGGAAAPDAGADGDGQGFHEPCNAVLDKFYFLGSARSVNQLGVSASAFTARNGILHRPNVGTGADGFGRSMSVGSGDPKDFSPACRREPLRFYNITVINEMDDVQSAGKGWSPVEIRPGCHDEGMVRVENIVVHQPNRTGGLTPDVPLDGTRLDFVPRFLGYAWKSHPANNKGKSVKLPMDTSFATPGKPWSLWRPLAGSPAIGSATGDLVAYDDILGNVRPVKASRGAIEPLAA